MKNLLRSSNIENYYFNEGGFCVLGYAILSVALACKYIYPYHLSASNHTAM